MACYHPIQGYYSNEINPSGLRSIVFNPNNGFRDRPITLPCGRCSGCRLEHSRQWAIRCMHEASLYDDHNSFITLTYSDEHMPKFGTLDKQDFQKFMKRLRKETSGIMPLTYNDKITYPIRYYHAGEYGEQTFRPHYHAIIFNYDFPDKKHFKNSKTGFPVYRSEQLERLWPFGHSEIGNVTFESAAYVARYIMKKANGELALQKYNYINPETGEIHYIQPEYSTMSRKPGIAKAWFDKYSTDVYPDDFIVMNGKTIKPPKYYDNQFEIIDPKTFKALKSQRKRKAKKSLHNTPERLNVREQLHELKIAKLIRKL